jgi:Ca2+-binding EF-hand superfamily protein
MEESSLKLSEDDLDSLTALLFESADEDSSGEISFEELKAELEKHPGVIDNLTIR